MLPVSPHTLDLRQLRLLTRMGSRARKQVLLTNQRAALPPSKEGARRPARVKRAKPGDESVKVWFFAAPGAALGTAGPGIPFLRCRAPLNSGIYS